MGLLSATAGRLKVEQRKTVLQCPGEAFQKMIQMTMAAARKVPLLALFNGHGDGSWVRSPCDDAGEPNLGLKWKD